MAAPAGARGATVNDIPALLDAQTGRDPEPLGALPHTLVVDNRPAVTQPADSVDRMPGTLDRSRASQNASHPPTATAPTTSGAPSDARDEDNDGCTTHLTAHEDR